MPDRDDDNRFTPQFEDEAFVDAVDAIEQPTTRNVADEVGCQKETARQRLKKLAKNGEIVEGRVGNVAVWELPE